VQSAVQVTLTAGVPVPRGGAPGSAGVTWGRETEAPAPSTRHCRHRLRPGGAWRWPFSAEAKPGKAVTWAGQSCELIERPGLVGSPIGTNDITSDR